MILQYNVATGSIQVRVPQAHELGGQLREDETALNFVLEKLI